MTTISVCLICLNEEEFIKPCIESVKDADEIIVVDGGSTDKTLEIIDALNLPNLTVYHRKWEMNWGAQRNYALSKATGDFVFQIDADEVLSDNGIDNLRAVAEQLKKDEVIFASISMNHFIKDFGHIDATLPVHWCFRRFFMNLKDKDEIQLISYKRQMHEFPQMNIEEPGKVSTAFGKTFQPDQPVLFHYGYCKGIKSIIDKQKINQKLSPIHSQEFLTKWKQDHLFGNYPVKNFTGQHPEPIRKMIE